MFDVPKGYVPRGGFAPRCECGHLIYRHWWLGYPHECRDRGCVCMAFEPSDGVWVETGRLWWKRGQWEKRTSEPQRAAAPGSRTGAAQKRDAAPSAGLGPAPIPVPVKDARQA